ncbi:AAA family ATPase [Dysgonomonas sp. Marseille-P4677]|uniref:AAA family ATPase n=1 Tax=Dysgonomonas sp. Marseille-P4677 TaxID=2364790 RepID=UPI001912C3C0|nr:AAA family ATPase [Dysgonomonas sp. Marseille-P4677]MBK5721062.1 AAA family ATPase [Dysgonomonas sp. Marseille-P4677]
MIWKITQNKNWDDLEKQFSWVADMKNVPQHKLHHAEGDVAIHTQMVLDELTKLPAYKTLSEQEQEILWAASLLHDVEKRSTSQDEGEGNISAIGHSSKGEYTTREILFKDIPTPFHIREQIASLVRFHSLPLWLMEKLEPAKRIHAISLRLNTQHLKLLAEADARGRHCSDLPILLESLDLFEMFCKEQECWGKALEFPTPNARFEYFNTIDGYVGYVPFDNFKCEVTMIAGLPGMGKDHYVKSLKSDIPVISLDAIRHNHKYSPSDKSVTGRVVQEAKEQARKYLRKKQSFIWNATNITRLMRQQLVDLFTLYGAKVKIVYVEKPYSIWRAQNLKRDSPVPENILDKMLRKLEIPQLTEAHEVEYVLNKEN